MITTRQGEVVAYWDGGALAFGLVTAEEKGRVRVRGPRGRETRVTPARIVVAVGAAQPGAAGRPGPAEEPAATVEREVREAAAQVEVGLLWEIVDEQRAAEPAAPALSARELAELALGDADGLAEAAVVLALVDDGLHFTRKGDGWLPRDGATLDDLRQQRAQVAQRQEETRELLDALRAAVAGSSFRERKTETERRYLDALVQVAVHEDAAPSAAGDLAREALEASGLRWDRPHEGAFRLLRSIGRFASDDENLQPLRFDLRTRFPEEVVAHARERAGRGFDRAGRRDLTGLLAVSIDGPHTREIDDLISLERVCDSLRVGVHIADPAAFVDPGDPVDDEALTRGLTHYMPDLRLPMLPAEISEEAASLQEGDERPALSFLVTLDAGGDVEEFEIVRSVVRSRSRLTYAEADAALEPGRGDAAPTLSRLGEFGALRERARVRRGAVSIQAAEVDLHVSPSGTPELESIPAGSPSRRAVSEAMIVAGEVAARFCIGARVPVIFRRQAAAAALPEMPPEGIRDPVEIRRVRRLLRRAEAGLEPGPHQSLGLDAYVQVTSPIRRFQDLATHRQIAAVLDGRAPHYDTEAMQRIAATTDRAEAHARRAEHAADNFWLLRYLEGSVGREIGAVVVDLEPRPIVQLAETLRESPMGGLSGVEPGQSIRVRIERVVPRAGLLVLRRVDG